MLHHARTLTLSGRARNGVDQTGAMVGCSGAQRLFVLEDTTDNNNPRQNVIYRIDPKSGNSDHAWLVDQRTQSLSVAGKDQLILATPDRIEQYNADGEMVREIPTNLGPGQCLREAKLLPDSTIMHYSS